MNRYEEQEGHHIKEDEYDWVRSDCPICGRDFPHKAGYTPKTCGSFDCLQEANRRGMLKGR